MRYAVHTIGSPNKQQTRRARTSRTQPDGSLCVTVDLLAVLNFLSKVEHEASLGLPRFYFFKCLVHLFKFAYFRDHLGFSCRLKLKRLSQIDSIPQSRSHYFDIARHDVKNR